MKYKYILYIINILYLYNNTITILPNPSIIPYCLMNKPLGIRNHRMSALEWILEYDSVVAKLWSLDQCQKFAPILNGKRKIKTIKWAFHKNQMYPFKNVFEIISFFEISFVLWSDGTRWELFICLLFWMPILGKMMLATLCCFNATPF